MVSMKLSPDEASEYSSPSAMCDAPQYPYGLSLTLDDEALEKLGIAIPEAGSYVMIMARAKVMNVNSSADMDGDGGPDVTVRLQIEEMEVSPSSEAKSSEDKLYGG